MYTGQSAGQSPVLLTFDPLYPNIVELKVNSLEFLMVCIRFTLPAAQRCLLYGICTHRCIPLQGLRIGGALSLSQARKVNVEPGCSVPDPCSSNPCPANSYCRDDWDSHSCTCLTGQSGTEQMTKQRSSLRENDRNYTNYKLCLFF